MPTKLFNHYDYHHIFRTHAVHNQLIHPVDRSQCLNVLAQAVGGVLSQASEAVATRDIRPQVRPRGVDH